MGWISIAEHFLSMFIFISCAQRGNGIFGKKMTRSQMKEKASYKKEQVTDVQMLLIWYQYHRQK